MEPTQIPPALAHGNCQNPAPTELEMDLDRLAGELATEYSVDPEEEKHPVRIQKNLCAGQVPIPQSN